MFKWFSVLIFINFILNSNSVTLFNRQTNINQAENALTPINDFKKALPLPLCIIPQGEELQLRAPEDIVQAEIENGVMVKGTEFSLSNSDVQLFLCPSLLPTELCLHPQDFNNLEPLACTQELKAYVIRDADFTTRVCNFQGAMFSSYRVIYRICDSDWYPYTTKEFMVYQFCYDEVNAKTLFTSHFIFSPKLLYSPLLIREQEVEYPYEGLIDGVEPANYIEIVNARNMQGIQLTGRALTTRSRYKPQRLVPVEDMALGVWRKTTYKPFNFEFQHENVIGVWNEMCAKLRDQLNQHQYHTKYLVSTGVFDNNVELTPPVNGQIYNRWIKLVIAKSTQNDRVFGGIVFMMNNFLDVDFEYHQSFLTPLQTEMQEYCPRDHCINAFKQIANVAQVKVKCCIVTPQIAQWFGYSFHNNLELLIIQGLSGLSYTSG